MMLGDAELSRRFFMQDEVEQKAKIDREQANELEYVDESQKSDAGRGEESISCRSSESNDFDLFLSGGYCGEDEFISE